MSELHPLVAGFSDAEAYERGRPGYPPEVVAAVGSALGLRHDSRVLDLGAGTGKLSRALVDAGYDTVAVEPMASMREVLSGAIGAERVRPGTAEAIPLPDAAVDAITCADSFHWFDERRAMPEIRRVLRPGGGVAILRANPRLEASWTQEMWELLLGYRHGHPAFGERPAAAALEEDGGFGAVREEVIAGRAHTDRDGVLAYVSTLSWIGGLDGERRREVLARVDGLLERERVTALSYGVDYRMWSARLSGQ